MGESNRSCPINRHVKGAMRQGLLDASYANGLGVALNPS